MSASSSGGISSSSYGQSAPPFPPFCSPIKSGRELWEEWDWDWVTSANTAVIYSLCIGNQK